MKIVNLVEDTKGSNCCGYEHGLSFYIETDNHKILADTGASDMILKNAQILDIDLTAVDTVILSHGHYDHSGGIIPFTKINPNAEIYMKESAGKDYFNGDRYIGIDKQILNLPQVIFTEDCMKIDDELSVFSNITGTRLRPSGNLSLSLKTESGMIQDSFDHEQCLVIKDNERLILISGCAHNGILNVLDRFREIYKNDPDIVLTGFHMMKKSAYTADEISDIEKTALELKEMNTLFYSGHCTGKPAFDIMKNIMNENLIEIHSGNILMEE